MICPVRLVLGGLEEDAREIVKLVLDDREGYTPRLAVDAIGEVTGHALDDHEVQAHRAGECECGEG